MGLCHRAVAQIGRVFISLIFILSAVNKIFNWGATLEGFSTLIDDWALYVCGIPWAEDLFAQVKEKLLPLLITATLFELVGGILVFLGIRTRLGAFLLILFLLPVTVIYHHFWFYAVQRRDLELIMFLKNIAILGGLFILYVFSRSTSKPIRPPEDLDSSFN